MRLTFLGHPGWMVESRDLRLLVDPILAPFFRNSAHSKVWVDLVMTLFAPPAAAGERWVLQSLLTGRGQTCSFFNPVDCPEELVERRGDLARRLAATHFHIEPEATPPAE